jgi:hypothetical protein
LVPPIAIDAGNGVEEPLHLKEKNANRRHRFGFGPAVC